MNDEQLLDELAHELEVHGHGADPVRDSPVHALNVWRDDAGRIPAATVVVEGGAYVWGHSWEHAAAVDRPLAQVVELIEGTWRA